MSDLDESTTGGTPVEDDSSPKVLEFRYDGASIKLKHLPLGVLGKVASKHNIMIPAQLVDGPLGLLPLEAAEDLFRACCHYLKLKAPKEVTFATYADAFHIVPDDEPDVWVDGRPPVGSPSTT